MDFMFFWHVRVSWVFVTKIKSQNITMVEYILFALYFCE